MELAIINGTYRPANQNKVAIQAPRLLNSVALTSPLRASPLGASIILSPTRISTASAPHGQLASVSSLIGGSATDMSAAAAAAAAAGLLYNPLDPTLAAAAAAAGYPYAALAPPILPADFAAFGQQAAGQLLA
ncbi:hypothetical protein D918_02037 [Trichuris suis]|nr:hypothetical protein D918_02037 [Trichuris suis]